MSDLKKLQALEELLTEDSAENMEKRLTEMWECWVTNEVNDMSTANERANVLYTYKNISQFLKRIA
jgi:hypothetical protein